MKIKNLLILFTSLLFLASCEIVQEIKFEEHGGGTYSLGFDMSEMMKMGMNSKDNTKNKQIDTIIDFAKVLEDKKDSIAKLSKKEQEKAALLKDFKLHMKSDTATNQLMMKMVYDFKDIAGLEKFGEKLKDQNFKELDMFNKKLAGKSKKTTENDNVFEKFDMMYATSFSKQKFTRKITEKSLNEAIKNKDTSITKDNPMSDMIRFKQRYVFPYKIKSVSNKNARILPNFKGIELQANLFEVNNNPKFFDVEVEFEK